MIIYLLQISVFHCTLYWIQAEHYHLHSNEPEVYTNQRNIKMYIVDPGIVILYTCQC